MMSTKPFNVKQAERWLQKLKTENLQSYKDVTKFLRKYERTEDEHDCYLKISHTLLAHTELTRELNLFLEEGNKFVVTRGEDEKLREFMNYAKNNRPQMFEQIITMTRELSISKGEGNTEVSKLIIPKVNEIVKGDPEMEQLTLETFNTNDDELIRKKNIDHLIVNRGYVPPPDDHKDNPPSESVMTSVKKAPNSEVKVTVCPPPALPLEEKKESKPVALGGLSSVGEEQAAIRQIEKALDFKAYRVLTKIVRIYYLNLITKKEALDLLSGLALEEPHFQNLRDILESREGDRRKNSFFKPLSDINFSNYERASPSYVTIPFFYPIQSSGKTPQSRALTNEKWISVPYGSEESENFSVRNKNTHEINLLKAEDERYEYDLYMKRLTKTKELLDKYIDSADSDTLDRHLLLRKAVNLGIIQLIYKHSKDEQKEEFEWHLNNHPLETSLFFRERLANEIREMASIRQNQAIKNWNEIGTKNFYKALDLKGFEFKKNQKDKMRNQYLIHELGERLKILVQGGEIKPSCLSVEEKKDFFTILNSFECSSKTEKCTSRTLPEIETFDLHNQRQRMFYPVFIMAFEDPDIISQLYSLLLFYIDASIITETEKYKAKVFLEQFLIGFLKWKPPVRKTLSEHYQEEQFAHKLADHSHPFNCSDCFLTYPEPLILKKLVEGEARKGEEKKGMKFMSNETSAYSYLPRGEGKSVFYCSEQVYCLTRYLYAAYERLVRMREVADCEETIKMFELLFFTSVKMKQGLKFQENLNLIFGKHAYLFMTIYKLFDSLVKSAVLSANCPITNSSFKFSEQEKCEDIYFLLLNRYCLSNNLFNQRLIRLTYQRPGQVLYVNTLNTYYKTDDLSKDMTKRRNQISRMVELETIDHYKGVRQKKKAGDYWQKNNQEYIFGSNSFKMVNHGSSSDVLVCRGKDQKAQKWVAREIKRAYTFHTYTH